MRAIPGMAALVGALDVIGVMADSGAYENEDEYKKALTGAIGGAVGGAGGAALGGALGTLLFPGVGTLIGGVAGGIIGNMAADKVTQLIYDKFFAEKTPSMPSAIPGLSEGGYVSKPTLALIGEGSEGEIVTPESKMRSLINETINEAKNQGISSDSAKMIETLSSELERLNNTMIEMVQYVKTTAEYSRRNVDATKSLNNNLFA